jgi:gamma-glutamyltranspeptidase/glutathione hydrolase
LAADGFPIVEFGEHEINLTAPELKAYPALYDAWAKTYLGGKGAVRVGQVLRQPDLARSLENIAGHGTKVLYGGALGRTIVDYLNKLGGCLSQADLEEVSPTWNDPVTANYRGLTINVPPPPCEGFQYLLTMRILEGFDICRMERLGLDHLDTVWRAIRIAAGVRIANNFADRDRVLELLSDANVEKLRNRVRDGKPVDGPTEQWIAPPEDAPKESHTTSMSIADRDGNAVCITNSIGSPFGSGIVVPGTGVILNNFLYWTDVGPKSPNRTKPGAALPMCVSPSINLRGGKCVLALGTPGSYGIKQTQAQALVQYVDYSLPLQDAIEAPRARLWDGRRVDIETRLASSVIEGLKRRGHDIVCTEAWTMRVGGMQGIAIDRETGAMTGACDPRRDGYVATG